MRGRNRLPTRDKYWSITQAHREGIRKAKAGAREGQCEGVQLAGQQQNKDKDNTGPPLKRVSYAVTKGVEKLNVLDTFSASGFEVFSNKILSAS